MYEKNVSLFKMEGKLDFSKIVSGFNAEKILIQYKQQKEDMISDSTSMMNFNALSDENANPKLNLEKGKSAQSFFSEDERFIFL
jgi:hypothetical protein